MRDGHAEVAVLPARTGASPEGAKPPPVNTFAPYLNDAVVVHLRVAREIDSAQLALGLVFSSPIGESFESTDAGSRRDARSASW